MTKEQTLAIDILLTCYPKATPLHKLTKFDDRCLQPNNRYPELKEMGRKDAGFMILWNDLQGSTISLSEHMVSPKNIEKTMDDLKAKFEQDDIINNARGDEMARVMCDMIRDIPVLSY